MSEQFSNNKRIAKNTLFLYLRMFFIMAVNLYTSRVVLKTLGVEDYGIYNVVGGVITMFAFLNSAMASATQRYLTFELGQSNTTGLTKVFSASIAIHILIAILILVLGETIGLWFVYNKLTIPEPRMDAAIWVYQFSILSTIVMIVSVPYNSVIIAYEKMSAFAYISIVEVLLKLGIVYVLWIIDFDKLKLYSILMFATQLLIRFIYGRYCKKHFQEVECNFSINKPLFKNMLSFAGWSLWGNLAAVFFSQGTNILLNMFFGPIVNAARAISSQVNAAVLQFSLSFQTAFNPQITKFYASNEMEQMHRLIYRASKFSYFLLLLITYPIILNTPCILYLWLGTYPRYTVDFVRIIIFCTIVDTVANPLMVSASATGRIRKYQFVIGSILMSILPISYICLKLGESPISVFIVQLCISLLSFFVRIVIVKPLIHLSVKKYMKEVVVRIIIVSLCTVPIPYLLSQYWGDSIKGMILSTVLSLGCSLISILSVGLSKTERTLILQKVSNIKRNFI